MNLLTPLGLLGLIGIAVLILIYLLKPNFQQKVISSTFVWKLSLRYKRKRIPINKFRNILIFICQLLIISSCAVILAQPYIPAEKVAENGERIIIVESSGNMLAGNGKTRFERAKEKAKELSEEMFSKGGVVSVIIAADQPEFLGQRESADGAEDLYARLDAKECYYGAARISAAMTYSESVLNVNPDAEIHFVTATDYIDHGNIIVDNVAAEETDANATWNAAILNVEAILTENSYTFEVTAACYGQDRSLMIGCTVYGANNGQTITLQKPVMCTNNEPQTLVFCTMEDEGARVFSYNSVSISLEENDSFEYDNSFQLFGGTKETLRVQYASNDPQRFFRDNVEVIQNSNLMLSHWQIELKENHNGTAQAEGFDYYIFEGALPSVLPTDGVLFLVDPETDISGTLGVELDFSRTGLVHPPLNDPEQPPTLTGVSHPLTEYMDMSRIMVTQYRRIATYGENYVPVMYFGSDPVMLVKRDGKSCVVIMTFRPKFSDFAARPDFATFLVNMINYFTPYTFSGYVFDVGDSVSVNARDEVLKVKGGGLDEEVKEFPGLLIPKVNGVVTLTQEKISGASVDEYFFVRVPNSESNIKRQYDYLERPVIDRSNLAKDYDILIWLAAALVTLLFAEWWLQSREYF